MGEFPVSVINAKGTFCSLGCLRNWSHAIRLFHPFRLEITDLGHEHLPNAVANSLFKIGGEQIQDTLEIEIPDRFSNQGGYL